MIIAAVWHRGKDESVREISPATTTTRKERPARDKRVADFGKNLTISPPSRSPHLAGSVENQDWIAKRVEDLESLAWSDTAEALGKILSELANPLPEIRMAALAAARDFGSQEALPHLEAMDPATLTPAEQQDLADTIDYLRLPPIIE